MQPLSFLELPQHPRNSNSGLGQYSRPTFDARFRLGLGCMLATLFAVVAGWAHAHGVADGDAIFLQSQQGFTFWPYFYLGAKHMVTGYDHLLFLAGVIFFLYKISDITVYVTLFALGHSLTLVAGVWFDIPANAYLIDAIIGLSVVYKAFENLGGFDKLGISINTKAAVWVFGLFHGFGLATKLQALTLSEDGLLGNLLAFNLGVEAGQLTALVGIVALMNLWRASARFESQASVANGLLMTCGFVLIGYQLTGYGLSI
ncbi:MAG: HupE/UreJ family protein [Pseudomonadaceae bacterium]|nr:HupE/UreJ family protein [Pseudomonadaceae bacterium]